MSHKRREIATPEEKLDKYTEEDSIYYEPKDSLFFHHIFVIKRVRDLLQTNYFTEKQRLILYLMIMEQKSLRSIAVITKANSAGVYHNYIRIVTKLRKYFKRIGALQPRKRNK